MQSGEQQVIVFIKFLLIAKLEDTRCPTQLAAVMIIDREVQKKGWILALVTASQSIKDDRRFLNFQRATVFDVSASLSAQTAFDTVLYD